MRDAHLGNHVTEILPLTTQLLLLLASSYLWNAKQKWIKRLVANVLILILTLNKLWGLGLTLHARHCSLLPTLLVVMWHQLYLISDLWADQPEKRNNMNNKMRCIIKPVTRMDQSHRLYFQVNSPQHRIWKDFANLLNCKIEHEWYMIHNPDIISS